jgi:hypothetical protein
MLKLIVFMAALLVPAAAQAQTFIAPLIGFDFGGDAGCPEVTACEDKNLNAGVAIGGMGSIFGAELELAYAKNFFGEMPAAESSVMTVMANVMVGPRIGFVQPYGVIGAGLLKSRVELTPAALLETTNNDPAWNIGGGIFILLGDHFGIRGDVRYFHSFQELEFLGFGLDGEKIDFGRAAGAVVLRF